VKFISGLLIRSSSGLIELRFVVKIKIKVRVRESRVNMVSKVSFKVNASRKVSEKPRMADPNQFDNDN